MNRIIRDPAVTAAPVFLGANSPLFLEGELAVLMEQTRAAAYEAGRRDGVAAGRAGMTQMAARIEAALAGAAVAAEQTRAAMIAEVIEAALTVTEYVTGVGQPDHAALLRRIDQAIAALDDEELVIRINRGDWEAVRDGLDLPPNVTIAADADLQPGEARLQGTWSSLELTTAAAMEVAREVLT